MTTPTPTVGRPPPVRPRDDRPVLVLVGGVPGAGKTTLIARTAADIVGARTLDPETHRRRIRAALPAWIPYRTYRPAVHVLHTLNMLAAVALGPAVDAGDRVLLVHDPATRPARRELLGHLARLRGWRSVLVFLDVTREQALDGQHRRGRVLKPSSFSGHWARWTTERPDLRAAAVEDRPVGAWDHVYVVNRHTAPALLRRLLN